MLRKSVGNHNDEDDRVSIGSLELPLNDSSHSSQRQQHHYPPPSQYAPTPAQYLPGHYYGHPCNRPDDDSESSSINFRIVLIVCAAFLTIMQISRPHTSIIAIDPYSSALRQSENANLQQGLSGGSLNSGGFSNQYESYRQQGLPSYAQAFSTMNSPRGQTSSGTMNSPVGQTSSGTMNGATTSSGMNGDIAAENTAASSGAYGVTTEGGATTDGTYGNNAAFNSHGDASGGAVSTTEGSYGEIPPEGATATVEMAPGWRLPGTLPGTGNIDLSLSDLNNFKDAWDPYEPSDNAVFWHIPKAGGSTVKDIIGTCHRFVMATEFGITDGHEYDKKIAVVYPGGGPVGQDRSPFVNVDTTTIEGIERAKQMGFADSGLADAVVTPFIYEANELFTPTAKGRLFTVFRHPIDRAISLFYYIQVADWEPSYRPDLQEWTLEQYATSDVAENNWMTRQLTNQLEGDLNDDHLALAMEVIRRKFLVGLMTQIGRTMERFERYFRWTYHVNPPNQEACRVRLLQGGSNTNASGNKKDKPQEGSEAYELLRLQNMYDLQLYEYIESLFEEQDEFVQDIPADFRNIDATCCKCYPATFPPEGFTCPLAILN
uniref:Sulfotransferase domain-containing protein n=1 Tax=Ditylum brightwellii TaxID=49249 RepID=A0A7S4VA19_9STRA